jgi:hypothetical protein
MILRMVRRQRPHWALQPRQRWTCAALRGAAAFTAVRTSRSLSTLQEQTIIEPGLGGLCNRGSAFRYRLRLGESKQIHSLKTF